LKRRENKKEKKQNGCGEEEKGIKKKIENEK
jgi:hypothetical protein